MARGPLGDYAIVDVASGVMAVRHGRRILLSWTAAPSVLRNPVRVLTSWCRDECTVASFATRTCSCFLISLWDASWMRLDLQISKLGIEIELRLSG